jgi:hypothetical protein
MGDTLNKLKPGEPKMEYVGGGKWNETAMSARDDHDGADDDDDDTAMRDVADDMDAGSKLDRKAKMEGISKLDRCTLVSIREACVYA